MSAGTRMYKLKPVVSLPDTLYHSKTMYGMKNIHERQTDEWRNVVTNITEQSPAPQFAALEARQERILSQLAELKKQVSTLCDFLKQTNHVDIAKETEVNCLRQNSQELLNISIVINANPTRPPYSLLILQKIWPNLVIQIQTHTHSSINTKVPKQFEKTDLLNERNNIHITLIWKKVNELEVITRWHSYPLQGEVNLLRYFSRLIADNNYETNNGTAHVYEIDTILDLCYALHYREASDVTTIFSLLEKKLEQKQFGNNKYTIADIAVWSSIKQISSKKLPSKLSKWFDTFEKMLQ
ncbi:probable aminoacyl tRNA synthase complex-interacting multifunctional protein 2 isoform X2 [Prorops nasuta]|uniref:probable aminoacyl tRNA synthase complex-interacting multifunctional protein 2 isoform X2 n=1 Tax=Prorops nasuta TaxID=863751 RepID=UPI0034CF6CA1